MINHLSQDQFAKCLVGQAGQEELQHLGECPECRGELDRFSSTLSVFRGSIRDRVDAWGAVQPAAVPRIPARRASAWIPAWSLGALAATVALVLGILPSVPVAQKPPQINEASSAEPSPEDLMNAVNLHLSRMLPGPMEPMLALMPNEETGPQSGGTQ